MQNSDLVFNVLTAAAAFGAAIVLAPSAARNDAPSQPYAGVRAAPSEMRQPAAMFVESEASKNVHSTSTDQGDSRLQTIVKPASARVGSKASRP